METEFPPSTSIKRRYYVHSIHVTSSLLDSMAVNPTIQHGQCATVVGNILWNTFLLAHQNTLDNIWHDSAIGAKFPTEWLNLWVSNKAVSTVLASKEKWRWILLFHKCDTTWTGRSFYTLMKILLPSFKGITDSLLFCSEDWGGTRLRNVGKFRQGNRTSNDIRTGKVNGEISNRLCLGRDNHCCGQANRSRKISDQIQTGVLVKIE